MLPLRGMGCSYSLPLATQAFHAVVRTHEEYYTGSCGLATGTMLRGVVLFIL